VNHQLAQLNIARFRLPMKHRKNDDFVNQLDHINAIAEKQQGFVWRLTTDLESLKAFVYRNPAHREIMRRRKEWFEKIETYQVLWWINPGHIPTLTEAQARLKHLRENGSSSFAFTFSASASPPSENIQK